jgi:hypothetical protein
VTLKYAILERLVRDDLKRISDQLAVAEVDRRSAVATRDKISHLHRATPNLLLPFTTEGDVKAVAKAYGMDPTGRKSELIQKLVRDGWARKPTAG